MAICPKCGGMLEPQIERRLVRDAFRVEHVCGAKLRLRPDLAWALYLSMTLAVFFVIEIVVAGELWGVLLFGLLWLAMHGARGMAVRFGYVSEINPVDDAAVGYRLLIAGLLMLGVAGLALGLLRP